MAKKKSKRASRRSSGDGLVDYRKTLAPISGLVTEEYDAFYQQLGSGRQGIAVGAAFCTMLAADDGHWQGLVYYYHMLYKGKGLDLFDRGIAFDILLGNRDAYEVIDDLRRKHPGRFQ